MTIYKWLRQRGLKVRWAAKHLIGVHYGSLWRINKTGICSAEVAMKIYELTKGEVDYRK